MLSFLHFWFPGRVPSIKKKRFGEIALCRCVIIWACCLLHHTTPPPLRPWFFVHRSIIAASFTLCCWVNALHSTQHKCITLLVLSFLAPCLSIQKELDSRAHLCCLHNFVDMCAPTSRTLPPPVELDSFASFLFACALLPLHTFAAAPFLNAHSSLPRDKCAS